MATAEEAAAPFFDTRYHLRNGYCHSKLIVQRRPAKLSTVQTKHFRSEALEHPTAMLSSMEF